MRTTHRGHAPHLGAAVTSVVFDNSRRNGVGADAGGAFVAGRALGASS